MDLKNAMNVICDKDWDKVSFFGKILMIAECLLIGYFGVKMYSNKD